MNIAFISDTRRSNVNEHLRLQHHHQTIGKHYHKRHYHNDVFTQYSETLNEYDEATIRGWLEYHWSSKNTKETITRKTEHK